MSSLLCCLLLTEGAATLTVTTPGLSIIFNETTAAPVSVKNSKGEELLDLTSPQPGFYIQQPGNRTLVSFDNVKQVGTNELIFSVAATGEQIGWVFGGTGHYLTANCTLTRGFHEGHEQPHWYDDRTVIFCADGQRSPRHRAQFHGV